ncbi:hypothetical protein [Sphingobacterium bovistauri]|uniref:DUF4328 domain-containing protein n=1 Tax=Sphingobacterium bovistauri TaxID=2781959 RepID=A0ABS7Z8R0_9SPHI|nr:hypothetical protein [Sphingobacterium bovistauri]MCA5006592.1 hypothetical protein [Sphingobacterium bovistauri]
MNELLNDPEFQKLIPYLPWLVAIVVIQIIIWLLLGYTIRKVLLLIKKENRLLPPNQAFLLAVPLLNIFWNFIVVRNLRDSLNNEFYDRKVAIDENPTQNEGNIFAWSFLVGNLPLPLIGYIASFTYIVGIVLYWRKIISYKRLLESSSTDDGANVQSSMDKEEIE